MQTPSVAWADSNHLWTYKFFLISGYYPEKSKHEGITLFLKHASNLEGITLCDAKTPTQPSNALYSLLCCSSLSFSNLQIQPTFPDLSDAELLQRKWAFEIIRSALTPREIIAPPKGSEASRTLYSFDLPNKLTPSLTQTWLSSNRFNPLYLLSKPNLFVSRLHTQALPRQTLCNGE